MKKILEVLKKIEKFIGGLWECEFWVNRQLLNFGSWKVLISMPAHITIGFLCALAIMLITGSYWYGSIIGGLSTAILLEGKDIYKYTSKEDYTMYLQSVIDSVFYILGAALIFLMRL